MKTSEYFQRFKDSSNKSDELVKIANCMMQEIVDITEARHINKPESMVTVVLEIDAKWRKFASLVNSYAGKKDLVKYSGLLRLVQLYSPELFELTVEKLRILNCLFRVN